MRNGLKMLSVIFSIPVLAIAFGAGILILGEGYSILFPGIDTRYAKEFSQDKFDKVDVGIDTNQVYQLIGKPFGDPYHWFDPYVKGYVWNYTDDGGCSCYDFAWLNKYVVIGKNGKVVMKGEVVSYD